MPLGYENELYQPYVLEGQPFHKIAITKSLAKLETDLHVVIV